MPNTVNQLTSRTLADWLAWIETLHPRTIELGLERVHAVLTNMKLRKPSFTVITISGTNGKGSTAAMCETILRRARYRVGTYTSPHLIAFNERIRIDGRVVSDESLCESFERIEALRGTVPLTYFEFGTLAAIDLFQAAGIEIAVMEVGMGGRLDAVNAIDADAAIVASVDIDHTSWLGNTREEIGREKAGIFRHNRPAICGDPHPPRVIAEEAERIGAKMLQYNRDFYVDRTPTEWCWRYADRMRTGLPYPVLRGDHQLRNAASALMALETIANRFPVTQSDIREGLISAVIPGRFQVLTGRPVTILDVAHNAEAARSLATTLKQQPIAGRTLGVLGMLKDKDIASVVAPLTGVVNHWFPATLNVARGATAMQLMESLTSVNVNAPERGYDNVRQAYAAARDEATESDRIVVLGSFYTVGDILEAISSPQYSK